MGQTPTHCPHRTQVVSGMGLIEERADLGLVAASAEIDGKRVLGVLSADLHATPAQQALGVVADVHRIVVLDRGFTTLGAGEAIVDGPVFDIMVRISGASERSMVEASISRMVLRARSTRSLRVCTFMSAAALTMQAGWSSLWPSTSTTQIRHRALVVVAS